MCYRLLKLLVSTCSEERRRRVKRYLSYFVIVCNFFLGGFEFGVIFPTAMDYLASLGAPRGGETTLFGLMIVCYAAANIVGGYVGGLWADMFVETRPLLVLAALPQTIGNALYFFAASPAGAIAGHTLSGLGSGTNTAMLAELTRTTSLTHRTGVIGVIMFARQLGIVCGPAVGAYLTNMPDIFRHRVTLLNAPGLLLTFCYLVYMVLLTLFYSNLTIDKDENSVDGQLRRAALTEASVAEAEAGAVAVAVAVAAGQTSRPFSRQAGTGGGQRQRRDASDCPETPENTLEKRARSALPPGPTPANTPLPRVQAGAATATVAVVHTPQRSLVLSLPQPSPNQCSSWPAYQILEPSSEDFEDAEDGSDGPATSAAIYTKSTDTAAPSETQQRRAEQRAVWLHTPDLQLRSCGCPHQEQCAASSSTCTLTRRSSIIAGPASVVREWRELLCWPIAALLVCNFTTYVAQTSLEAVLPSLVEHDLRLTIDATGRIFIAGGLVQCLVLVCIFVTPLLPCMSDKRLITTGLLVMVAAHVFLLTTICMLRDSAKEGGYAAADWASPPPSPLPPRDQRWFWVVLVGSGVQFFGYPLVNSVVTSFMSKMLSRGAQGVGAAGLRLSMCTGLMLGPVWGSNMVHHQLPLLLSPLAILLCALLLFCWFERRGAFRECMRQAATVDMITPRVCVAPRRTHTISALSQIQGSARDGASDDPLGGSGSDSCGAGKRKPFD